MKKILVIIGLIIGVSIFNACDKDDDFAQPKPTDWQVSTTESFSTTMTAVVVLPDNLLKHAQDDDMVAAFMGDKCRGEGKLVKTDEQRYYFLTIKGFSEEQGKITFKYYNTNRSFMYTTDPVLDFEPDGIWGGIDNPKTLELKGVK